MIFVLFAKFFLFLLGLLDILLGSLGNYFIDLPIAVSTISSTMYKITLYFYAIAPHFFSMLYSWIFFYFNLWLIVRLMTWAKLFIPRSSQPVQ